MRNKKVKAVIAAMAISAMTTVTAFAATRTVTAPTITYSSIDYGQEIQITGQMTSSTAEYLAVTQYAIYSNRGSSTLTTGPKTTTESNGAATSVTGSCTYTLMNGDHKSYVMAYNEGYFKVPGYQDYILCETKSTKF